MKTVDRHRTPKLTQASGHLGQSRGTASMPAPAVQLRAGQVSQREDDAQAPVSASPLQHPRFAGIPKLQAIRAGKPAKLSRRQNGTPVKAVQKALIDLGYTLPRFKDDGKFGGETKQATRIFKTDRGMAGEAMDSEGLGRLDQDAPPLGQKEEKTFDYGRLLADNKLDFAFGIGFDEGKTHGPAEEKLRAYLSGEGFSETKASTPGISKFSKDTFVFDPSLGIFRYITVNVTLISPGVGASDAFMNAMNDSEITMYSGHARGGLGPDFDDKHKADEQQVWGRSSKLHNKRGSTVRTPKDSYYRTVSGGRKNDLEQLRDENFWKTDKYRVWFFNACTSLNYLDELRGGLLPKEITQKNMDFIGTNRSIPSATSGDNMIHLLESILAAESIDQLLTRLNTTNDASLEKIISNPEYKAHHEKAKKMKSPFFMEGQGDNPTVKKPGTGPI